MRTTSTILRTGALMLCILSSACMSMQHQLDRHERDLAQLSEQVSRLQANSHSDMQQLRSDMQALSGTIEENNVVHDRAIKALRARLESMTAATSPPSVEPHPGSASVSGQPAAAVDTEQALYDRALELYYAREYAQSRTSFQAFAQQYPTSHLTQNALFWIGMCLFQQKNYQASIAALENLIKTFPQGTKVPDASYWQALAFIELKETLTAQILLETLMQTYPTSEAAQRAKTKYEELTAGQQ